MTFFAHFHPVIVHLPIGIILAALLLQLLAARPAYAALRPAVPVLLLVGFLSALASCVTGWLLSQSGEYDEGLVGWHMWMGFCLTGLSGVVYVRVRRGSSSQSGSLRTGENGWIDRGLSLGLLGLVVVTGHLGGSLTHGADYLSFGGGSGAAAEVDSPIVNVQAARAYAQVVRPILRDNCYSCHGATRQKGGLRLDDTGAILKGGKDGVVVSPGRGGASELIKRLLLPEGDEHHMPPKEKKQLNERQILLLHWWIDQGADVSRTVGELKQPDSVRAALLSVQGRGLRPGVSGGLGGADVPEEVVEAVDARAVAALTAKGVRVMPVAQGSHWLEVEAAGGGGGASGIGSVRGWLPLLLPLKKQLIALRLDGLGIGDSVMTVIGQCGALRELDLAGNPIGDVGLAELKRLTELRVLNLVGTQVSAPGVLRLRELKKLRAVYLYKTRVGRLDWAELRKGFPGVELDTGGYSLPALVTDTAVVRKGKGL